MAESRRTTRSKRVGLWLGAILSLPASGYFTTSFVFYAWLNAAEPERWPPERAAPWAYGSILLAVLSLVVFIWCVAKLIRSRA